MPLVRFALISSAAALAMFTAPTISAAATQAGQIVRHQAPGGQSLILQGVSVPANAEMLYLSGQLASPIDPARTDGVAAYGNTRTQTASVLNKIKGLLEQRGYRMADIVKMTVFLGADPQTGRLDAAGMNDAFKTFFGTAENPNTVARSTVEVANLVSPNFLVEIEVIAAKVP